MFLEVDDSFVGDPIPLELDLRLCRLDCLGASDASLVAELLMDWRRLVILGASDCSSFGFPWFWWRLDDGFGSSVKSLLRETSVSLQPPHGPEEMCFAERQKMDHCV